MKDFFTAYNNANVRKYMRSGVIALALSVTIVSTFSQALPQSSILANVLEAGSQEIVTYSADLIMDREGNDAVFRLGKQAYDVNLLSFTLLGDPERFLGLTSIDKNTEIIHNEPGVYMVKIHRNASYIQAGEVFARLTPVLSGETQITPIDAILTSGTQSYTLSIQGEEE